MSEGFSIFAAHKLFHSKIATWAEAIKKPQKARDSKDLLVKVDQQMLLNLKSQL